MIRAFGLDDALAAGECTEAEITDGGRARRRHPAALPRGAHASPARPSTCWRRAEHRALAREAATKAAVLLRNEPVDGAPLLPLDAGALPTRGGDRPPGRGPQPGRRRVERRVGARRWSPRSTGCAPPCPTPRSCTRDDDAARSRPAPTSPSWWSATPRPTRASSSATAAPPTWPRSCPAADEPEVVARLRGRAWPAEEHDFQPPDGRRPAIVRLLHGRRPRVAAPPPRGRGADRRGGRGQPPHGRVHRGRQRRADRRVGPGTCPPSCSPGTRAWRAATPWPTCCSAGPSPAAACRSPCPPTPPTCPHFDRDADADHLRRLARVLEARRRRPRGRLPLRVRPQLHRPVAAGHGRGPARRRDRGHHHLRATPGSAPASRWSRPTPRSGDGPAKLVGFLRVELDPGERKVVEVRFPIARWPAGTPTPSGWSRSTARCRSRWPATPATPPPPPSPSSSPAPLTPLTRMRYRGCPATTVTPERRCRLPSGLVGNGPARS